MEDPFELQRFIDAQRPVISDVRAELQAGRKRTHWMWFIFPQIAGLGHSDMAQRYALASCRQARAFAAHPGLGATLRELVGTVNAHDDRAVSDIFGYPDDLKFHSSMTLFAQCADEKDPFETALATFFDGQPDTATLERLR